MYACLYNHSDQEEFYVCINLAEVQIQNLIYAKYIIQNAYYRIRGLEE